jgi:ABC-type nitrate/sulfonate/bicarbonate transport system permease component
MHADLAQRLSVPAPGEMPLPAERSRLARLYHDHYAVLWGTIGVVGVLVLWELAAALRWVNPFFSSSPRLVSIALTEYAASGEMLRDMSLSLQEFLLGMGLSIVVGIPLGVILGWYRYPYAWLNPFVSALYATPRISFAPLIIIWFGIGLASKVFLVFFGALFPILLNTMVAFRTLDPDLVRAARSFRASDMQLFRTIALPASVPIILTGVRLGIGRGLIGMIVGEFYASTAGVGHWISTAGSTLQSDKLFVGVVLVGAMGVGLAAIVGLVERRFDAWRVSAHARET